MLMLVSACDKTSYTRQTGNESKVLGTPNLQHLCQEIASRLYGTCRIYSTKVSSQSNAAVLLLNCGTQSSRKDISENQPERRGRKNAR